MSRIDNRKNDEMRKIKMTTGFVSSADGSVLIEMGHTRVLCNATLLPEVPKWLAGKGRGWITAEYSLLPQSTGQRVERERKGARVRFATVATAVNTRLHDVSKQAADIAAWRAQKDLAGGQPTLKAYIWAQELDKYDQAHQG